MNVIGLDISTKTGLARPDGSLLRIHLRTPAKSDPGRRQHELVARLETELRRWPPFPPALAVVEEALFAGPGVQSALVTAGFRAVVHERLFAWGVEVVEVSPSRLKRYATGDGGADKARMIAAAQHEGAMPENDDEADAFWAWHAGRLAMGLHPATRVRDRHQARHLEAARLEVVAALTWPRIRR